MKEQKTNFSISAKTCTLMFNSQENGGIILGNNLKYVIPIYQRPYSWGNKEINKFLSDIFISYWGNNEEIVEDSMFIGTVQLSDVNDVGLQDIIDGQQRFTTFLILLKVIKLKFPNSVSLSQIKFDWLSTRVENGSQQEKLNELIDSDLNIEGKINNTYLENALLINEFIEQQTKIDNIEFQQEFDVDRFVKHIVSNIYFVVIETKAGLSKTLQIFNAINTTGLDLNGGDIFKIKMFEYLTKKKGFDDDAFNLISSLYKKIEDLNNERGDIVTTILGILGIYQSVIIAKYQLPITLHNYGSDTFFERLFDTILNVNQWEHFKNNVSNVDLSIEDLDKIIDARYMWEDNWYKTAEDACSYKLIATSRYGKYCDDIPVLLIFKLQEVNDDVFTLVKKLSKLYFAYSIRYLRSVYEMHRFTYSLISLIINNTYQELINEIDKKLEDIKEHKEWWILNPLNSEIAYNSILKNQICRLSAMLEEDYSSNNKEQITSLVKLLFESPIDIEHIQSYHDSNGDKREEIWNQWADDLNSIGNLVVLEQGINRSISNGIYDYKTKSYVLSNFQIVKNQAANYSDWTLENCKQRKTKEINKILNYLFN